MATTRTTTTHAPAHARAHAVHDAPHHEHGTMDIVEHERPFDGFVRFMTWSAVLTILVLIFLALTNA